jgi:hypothetical protein
MTSTKTIEDKELGEIKLSKYKRGKYLKIRMVEDGKVAISMPYHVKFDDGLRFLNEKRDWVKEQLLISKSKQLKLNGDTEFKTKSRDLELIPCDVAKATYRLSPTKIKVYYPNTDNPQKPAIQELIKTAIEAALRREAHNYLPIRLQQLANQHGLKYNQISIRNTRTRWGSCTHDNNINLCMHLMKLPNELIDYVLLHELAHTVEKNHSVRFWDLLSTMLGQNSKTIDKMLKAYRPGI